jgi:aldose sugar dehydrogenase
MYPTSMAFLGPDDILVLEKNAGTVRRIVNNTLLLKPLIDLDVTNAWERGLLGIDVANTGANVPNTHDIFDYNENQSGAEQGRGDGLNRTKYVFLYLTKREQMSKHSGELCVRPNMCKDGKNIANYLYRYEFKNDRLVNPKLLLKIPGGPGADHIGGAVEVGHDNNVYVTVGDGDSCYSGSCYENFEASVLNSTRSNFKNGTEPDGRGGILRITQDGKTVSAGNGTEVQQSGIMLKDGEGILGDMHPLNKYYAYGIRNSFGIDFDPVTGKLWDTENGAGFGDEINLVEPGFNSGWAKWQGVWPVSNFTPSPLFKGFFDDSKTGNTIMPLDQDILVDFNGKGKYSLPEFTWNVPVAPTALKFYNSGRLGSEYENDMFVADFLNGNIYRYDLNEKRTELEFKGVLEDRIANNTKELEDALFVQGIAIGGGITDIEVGPWDGYLYLVSHTQGTIYRIIPKDKK